jgi:hypothetical protein
MGDIIIIDPKKLDVNFEDITAFKLINFLFVGIEGYDWKWSTIDDLYEDIRADFLEPTDTNQTLIVLDFDEEEISLVEFTVHVEEVIKKTNIITITKVES